MAYGTYLMMNILPRQSLGRNVMIFAFTCLTYQNIRSMLSDNQYDMSVMFNMLMVCKLTALAYCIEDGSVKEGDKIQLTKE
jgi:hypothetical protein